MKKKLSVLSRCKGWSLTIAGLFLPPIFAAHPRWGNWSQCLGKCNVKFQIRKCEDRCEEKKLEMRACPVGDGYNYCRSE